MATYQKGKYTLRDRRLEEEYGADDCDSDIDTDVEEEEDELLAAFLVAEDDEINPVGVDIVPDHDDDADANVVEPVAITNNDPLEDNVNKKRDKKGFPDDCIYFDEKL